MVLNKESAPNEAKEKAKKHSIESLLPANHERQTGRVKMFICPWHADETPSLAVYRDTNSFFCFACGVGGDVIAFYMKLKSVDFKTALKELNQ